MQLTKWAAGVLMPVERQRHHEHVCVAEASVLAIASDAPVSCHRAELMRSTADCRGGDNDEGSASDRAPSGGSTWPHSLRGGSAAPVVATSGRDHRIERALRRKMHGLPARR